MSILIREKKAMTGLFRGILKAFPTSRVRKVIISKGVPFHPSEVCPYCKARVWSMLQAKI